MRVGDFLEKWGRTLFEAPLAAKADEPAELAEIRLAVLDRVKEKSYRSGARKVFPYDLLRVELRGLERGDQGCTPAASSSNTWSRKCAMRCARRVAGIRKLCGCG